MSSIPLNGEVVTITSQEDFDKYIAQGGDTLIVVDFYADWCGPCKFIGPKVEAMAKEFADVFFAKVNVDDQSEVSEECKIEAMPTFQFYKNGKKLDEFKGASEAKLRELVVKHK